MLPSGSFGVGVIQFVTRRVFGDFYCAGMVVGGDGRYYLAGTYAVENDAMTGEMDVVHYAGDPYPAFGSESNLRLALRCKLDSGVTRDVIEMPAEPVGEPGRQLLFRLTRRVEFD
jgi:hypothetical protein